MIKSNLKPMEEIEKEAKEYRPKAGDEVWTFDIDAENPRIYGPFTVDRISKEGIVYVHDNPQGMVAFSVSHTSNTRHGAAFLAADYYRYKLMVRKSRLGRTEYDIDKFCSKEGIL